MNPKLQLSADNAYYHLRNAITTGKILPGERVITQQIATELRLSRTPIKEALARAEADGMVVRAGNWGYTVREITLRDAENIFEARMVVELACAQIAADNSNASDHEEMTRLWSKAHAAFTKGRLSDFLLASRQLHGFIAKCTGNDILLNLFNQVNNLVLLFALSLLRANPKRAAEIDAENKALIEAIKQKDKDLAGRLIRSQVVRAYEMYHQTLTNNQSNRIIKLKELVS